MDFSDYSSEQGGTDFDEGEEYDEEVLAGFPGLFGWAHRTAADTAKEKELAAARRSAAKLAEYLKILHPRDVLNLGVLCDTLLVVDCDTVEAADELEAAWPELASAPCEATSRGRHYFFARSQFSDEHGFFDGPHQVIPKVDVKTRTLGGGVGLVVTTPSTGKKWIRAPWDAAPGGLPEISDGLVAAVAVPKHVSLSVSLVFKAEEIKEGGGSEGGADTPPPPPPLVVSCPLLAQCSYIADTIEVGGLTSGMGHLSMGPGGGESGGDGPPKDAGSAAAGGGSEPSARLAALPAPPPRHAVVYLPPQITRAAFQDALRAMQGLDLTLPPQPPPPPPLPPPSSSSSPSSFSSSSHPPLLDAAAHDARIAVAAEVADFLGAPGKALASIRQASPGGGRSRGDQARVSPSWAAACVAAALASEAAAASPLIGDGSTRGLVSVGVALSSSLFYEPLLSAAPRDPRWLLPPLRRAWEADEHGRRAAAPGSPCLSPDPPASAASRLPPFVLRALRTEAGHLCLAGGAALAAVAAELPPPLAVPPNKPAAPKASQGPKSGGGGYQEWKSEYEKRQAAAKFEATAPPDASRAASDYDLFVYGFTGSRDEVSASADTLVRRLAALPGGPKGAGSIFASRNAVTFRIVPPSASSAAKGVHEPRPPGHAYRHGKWVAVEDPYLVQVVLRVASDVADVLSGFDLPPACVAIVADPPASAAAAAAAAASPAADAPPPPSDAAAAPPPSPKQPPKKQPAPQPTTTKAKPVVGGMAAFAPPTSPKSPQSPGGAASPNHGRAPSSSSITPAPPPPPALPPHPPPSPLRVVALPCWPVAVRHRAFAVDGRNWSRATALRVFKYMVSKGFDALVPALTDRSKVKHSITGSWWSPLAGLAVLDGYELVFAIEKVLTTAVTSPGWSLAFSTRALPKATKGAAHRRPTVQELSRVASRLGLYQRTDYGSAMKMLRRLQYAMIGYISDRTGSYSDPLAKPLGWRQPGSKAQFHPVSCDLVTALELDDKV